MTLSGGNLHKSTLIFIFLSIFVIDKALAITCPAGKVDPGNGTCVNCPAGQTSSNNICVNCPPGKFSANPGSSSCSTCSSGYISASGATICTACPAGSTSDTNRVTCVECGVGKYSATPGTTCSNCAVGYIAPNTGTVSCSACPAGTTSDTTRTSCTPCPAGKYSTAGSSCSTCPAGDYTPIEGMGACLPCPAGFEHNSGRTGCVECPVGTVSAESSTCSSCTLGWYTNSTASTYCKRCAPGDTSNKERTACVPCPVGEIKQGNGDCVTCFGSYPVPFPGSSECLSCENGFYGNNTNCAPCSDGRGAGNGYVCLGCGLSISLAGITCQYCPPGYGTVYTNAVECVPCPPGTYSTVDGCTACPYDSYNFKYGQSSCTKCPLGQIFNTVSNTCTDCPAGTFSTYAGCTTCAQGYYSAAKSSSCTRCPPGHKSNLDHTACIPCPAGTQRYSSDVCYTCGGNSYSNAGAESCTQCPTGTTAKADHTGCVPNGSNLGCTVLQYFNSASCVNCPSGQVRSSSGTSCVPCGPGYERTNGGCNECDDDEYGDGENCYQCDDTGSVPNAGHSACVTCPNGWGENYNGYCTPCLMDGYSNGNGRCTYCSGTDVPNSSKTGCVALTCTSPEEVTRLDGGISVCYERKQYCPNGKYKNFVTDTCDDCQVNSYSRDNLGGGVCMACPRGTHTNGLRGQSTCVACPAGQSTFSNFANCAVCGWGLTQDPSNNLCRACPPGFSTNETSISCIPCPPGTTTYGAGGNCTKCGVGSYSREAGGKCLYCPPGTKANDDRTNCVTCPVGTYSRGDGNGCVACSGNAISSIGAYQCTTCPTGYIANTLKTECLECTCELCPTGPVGCTNPAALNYVLNAVSDNGSCKYPNSDFVSDIVSCPKLAITTAAKIFNFPKFEGVSGMTMNAIRIGFLGYFDSTANAEVTLIAPSGKRVILISKGSITNTTCTLNLGFHSDSDYGEVVLGNSCNTAGFSIPCNGFFADNIYVNGLQSVLDEDPAGNWALEVKGSTGLFIRAQFAITQYYQLSPEYVSLQESDYLSCSQTANIVTVSVKNSAVSRLSIGSIISGYGCGTFVITVSSITPNGANSIVNGPITSIEKLFKELRIYGVQPEVTQTKRFEATLFSKEIKTGDIPVDDFLTASASIKVTFSTIMDISIGFFKISKVSIVNVGKFTAELKGTLGLNAGLEEEIIKTVFSQSVFTSVFVLPPGIPIPYEIGIGIDAGVKLELKAALAIVATATMSQSLHFGVEYKNGALHPIGKAETTFKSEVKLDYQCSVKANVIIGPTFSIGIGKDDFIYAPIIVKVLPYMGRQVIQSIGDNKKCCGDTSLENREYWGIDVKLKAEIKIGEKKYEIGDEVTVVNYERDINIQCFPNLPICPTMDCSNLPNETKEEPVGQSPPALGFGDPHFKSSDGCAFNFQGSGEYLLLEARDRTDKPPFVIQGRLLGSNNSPSWNQATYIRSIAMTQDPLVSVLVFGTNLYAGADPYSLFLNRELLNLPINCPYEFDGGIVVRNQKNIYRVDFDRGYTIEVKIVFNTMFLNVYMPSSAKGKNIGLLGSYDGIRENQFIGRDNVTYGTCSQYEYTNNCNTVNIWGQTFLISQNESMMIYKANENTTTYYRPLPGTVASNCASIDLTDPIVIEAANSACGSITDPDIYNACIWDIQITRGFDSVDSSTSANNNALYANYTVTNLAIQIGNFNEKLISWTPPSLPSNLDTAKTYDVQYRIITSSTTNLAEENGWITIASSISSTQFNFTNTFPQSLAISVRVRVKFAAVSANSAWATIERCIPLCTASSCCEDCNLFPCLACPLKFTCIPPELTCPAGYFDNQLLDYITNCTKCFVNSYSPGVSLDNEKCQPCPATTNTNSLEGSDLITDCGCNAGQGNPSSNIGSIPQCANCPVNKYSPTWTIGLTACLDCPSGSTTNGQIAATTCGCPAGSGSQTTDTKVINCRTCSTGYISPQFTLPGVLCTSCTAGMTSNDEHTECINCKAGQSSNVGGACFNCAAGKSSVAGGICTNCLAGTSSVSGGLCTNCPAGQTSVEGGPCLPCPLGQYSVPGGPCLLCNDGETYSNGACTKCPAGSFSTGSVPCSLCPAGSSSTQGATTCSQCNAGQYSKSGDLCTNCTAGQSSIAGSSSCTNCAAGKSSVSGGLCTNCVAGKSSVSGSLCTNCPAGSSSISGGSCYPCPDGEFNSEAGGLCTPCGPGSSSTDPHTSCFTCTNPMCDCQGGQIFSLGECINCPAGQSSVYPFEECFKCPAGQSSESGGVCNNCPEGQFSESGGLCSLCPSGQYSDGLICINCTAGQSSISGESCYVCPAGQYSVSGGLCTNCPAGKSSASESSSCTDCKVGQYSFEGGLCTSCSAGQSSTAGSSTCTNCPAGSVSVSGGVCTPCAAGKSSLSGSDTCFLCSAGQTSFEGGLCTSCPAGYSSESGDSECTQCLVGYISIAGGRCIACDAGKTSSSDHKTCEVCAAGSVSNSGSACSPCAAGKSSISGSDTCFLCSAGESSEEGGLCVDCPAGKFSVEGGLCTLCGAGQSSEEGSSECFECLGGETSIPGGLCTKCPAGTFSTVLEHETCIKCPAGQSSTNGSVNCLNCPAGQISIEGGLCTPCPAGYSSESGDSKCTKCLVGYISIAGGQCIACDAGKTSSSDHKTCVACPAGSVSNSGSACTQCTGNTVASATATVCIPCDEGKMPSSDHSRCIFITASNTPTRSFTATTTITPTPKPSRSASPTISLTSSVTPTAEPSRSVSPTISFTSSISKSWVPQSSSVVSRSQVVQNSNTASSSPAPTASHALIVRRSDVIPLEVTFECNKVRLAQCCDEFFENYVALEPEVNDVKLLQHIRCAEEKKEKRGVTLRVVITFNQFGSNFYESQDILDEYLHDSKCKTTPCYPSRNALESPLWTEILEINIVEDSTQQSSDSSNFLFKIFYLIPTLLIIVFVL